MLSNLLALFSGQSADPVFEIIGIVSVLIAVVIAIVFHDVAKGFVALKNGDSTAKDAGRLTFNPLVHLDPIGFLMLLVVGFGFSKPMPINKYRFRNQKKGTIMVALAGIVANLIVAIVFLFFFVLILFIASKVPMNGILLVTLITLCLWIAQINLFYMLFHLLPFGMLDGYIILEAIFGYGNKVVRFLRTYGRYIIFGLFGVSIICNYFVGSLSFLQYVDILGLYIKFCSEWIIVGITWVFKAMFGLL